MRNECFRKIQSQKKLTTSKRSSPELFRGKSGLGMKTATGFTFSVFQRTFSAFADNYDGTTGIGMVLGKLEYM